MVQVCQVKGFNQSQFILHVILQDRLDATVIYYVKGINSAPAFHISLVLWDQFLHI